MNQRLPSTKKLVPMIKRLKAIFRKASACFLRVLDPILYSLPTELADAIFGESGREAGAGVIQSGGAASKAASTKKHKRAPRTRLTVAEYRAWEVNREEGSYAAAARKLGISPQGVRKLVKKAEAKIDSASRSVHAKQTLPKDPRGQEMVPDTE